MWFRELRLFASSLGRGLQALGAVCVIDETSAGLSSTGRRGTTAGGGRSGRESQAGRGLARPGVQRMRRRGGATCHAAPPWEWGPQSPSRYLHRRWKLVSRQPRTDSVGKGTPRHPGQQWGAPHPHHLSLVPVSPAGEGQCPRNTVTCRYGPQAKFNACLLGGCGSAQWAVL